MRLLFFGSGSFGLPTLASLHAAHEVLAVISQPDKPAGRKRVPTPTPIAAWAEAQGLPVLKAEDVNTPAFVAQVAAFRAEASVVIAFGQKLSPPLIAAMGRLAVNLHASLLPRYRGAAPINRAMIDGEAVTGVSVIGLAQRMDAGEVYATARTPIDPLETAGELHDRLARLGPEAVAGVLRSLEAHTLAPLEQDHAAATRAPKFSKADGTADFAQPAAVVRARVHGLTPWPGCRVMWTPTPGDAPRPLTLLRVRDHDGSAAGGESAPGEPGAIRADGRVVCGSGSLEVLEMQLPGGRPLTLDAFKRGHPWAAGGRLAPLDMS